SFLEYGMAKWTDPEGSSDEPEFMACYGRAMAEWGDVEHQLARLYCKLLKPQNIEHATLAFFAVQNFRDRTNMISSLVLSKYGPDDNPDPHVMSVKWSRILRALNRTAKNRNRLAHLHVWHGPEYGTFGHGHIFEVFQLPTDAKERAKHVVG